MIQRFILLLGIFFFANASYAQLQSIEGNLSSGSEISVESCADTLALTLSSRVLEDTAFFEVLISGSANRDDDYLIDLPDTLLFTSGQIEQSFTFSFVADGIDEGVESIIIAFRNIDTRENFAFTLSLYDEIPLSISAPNTDTACLKNAFQLNAFGAGSYAWYKNNGDTISRQSQFDYYPNDRDTIFLRGRIHDCFKDTFIVIDYFEDQLNLNVRDTLFLCKGDSGTVRANGVNGDIVWRSDIPGIVNPIMGESVTIQTDNSSYVIARLNGENCVIEDTIFVRVDSLPPFTLQNVPLPNPDCNKYCKGDTFSIISNTANPTIYPDVTFSWVPTDNSILIGEENQDIIAEAQDSNYYIRTTSNNACESIDSIFIEVIDPLMELTLRDTTVCANKPVSVQILNPELYSEISWTPAQGLSCADCPNPTITTANTQTYMVMATKENCCPTSASITVNINIPPIPIDPVITCPGENVQIEVNDAILMDPNWVGNTDGLSCTDCFDPIANTNERREYLFQAIDTAGCLSQGTAVVNLYPDLDEITLMAEPNTDIGIGGTVNIITETRPEIADTNNITYTINGEPLQVSGNDVNIFILEEGENVITAFVVDDNGCIRSSSIIINGVPPDIDIPNAFSPNGDEMNDFFRPVITNADNIEGFISEFRVFSRWGQMVYERTNNNDQGWDGNYNGQQAPPEVYMYYIELIYPNGDVEVLKGDVTLVR